MTGDTTVDTVVHDYLWRVGSALSGVPAARAREITDELAEHIREAREDGAVVTEADARNLLDRLGEPADIAVEAERRFGRLGRPRAGAREVFAILLLGVSGVFIPVVGWLIGTVLLWTSESWNRRDKILGTVLTVGALPGFALLAIVPITVTGTSTITDPSGRVISTSTQSFSSGPPAFVGPLVLFAVLVLPLLTAVYLLVRLRVARRPVAPNG